MTLQSDASGATAVGRGHTRENKVSIDIDRSTVSVLVAERSEVLRHGLSQFVAGRTDFELVGETSSLVELLTLVADQSPDVLILDVHFGNIDGISAAQAVKNQSPNTQVLLFGESERIEDIRAVLDTSVRGYLLKQADFDEVESAIWQVSIGRDYISESLALKLLNDLNTGEMDKEPPPQHLQTLGLTAREQEIMTLVCTGLTSAQIGAELDRAEKTIKHHLTSIYRKLGVSNRVQAIQAVNELRTG